MISYIHINTYSYIYSINESCVCSFFITSENLLDADLTKAVLARASSARTGGCAWATPSLCGSGGAMVDQLV